MRYRLMLGTAMLWLVLGQIEPAEAGSLAYVVAHDFSGCTSPDLFGQVDVTTGQFNQIGDLNTSGYTIFGMSFGPNGQIYGEGSLCTQPRANGELFSINPTTGAATDLGPLNFPPDGAAGNGNGTLFSLDFAAPSAGLFSMVLPSNSATLIGNVPFTADGLVAVDSEGNLFAAGNGDGSFYEVNTTDASSMLIGNTGSMQSPPCAFQACGYSSTLFAGTFIGNTLYGFSANTPNNTIVTIDTSNAAMTIGPNIDLPENYQISAATASAVPEPATLALMVMGVVGIGASRRSIKPSGRG
jgi:hypothetical protein